jgi:O-antigen ligase
MIQNLNQAAPSCPVVPAGHWLSRIVAGIMFLTLAVGLVLPHALGIGFFLVAIMAMVWLTRHRLWGRMDLTKHERLLLFGIFVYVGVWVIAWLAHGMPVGASALDRTLRLLLIIPVYLFIRQVDGLERAWWLGLTIGAIGAGSYALWQVLMHTSGPFVLRVEGTTNPIYFGGIALIFGIMLLPRISDGRLPTAIRALAAFAVFMALAASALSGSRGVWIGIPIILGIYLWTLGLRQPPRWRFGVPAVLLLLTLAVIMLPHSPLVERTVIGLFELIALAEGRVAEDSIGLRMELWHLAWRTGIEHLPLGGGPGAYREAIELAVANGRLDERFLAFRHEHNQFFTALTIAGLPGLLSAVLLFGLPQLRFTRLWQSGLERTRFLGWCGLSALLLLTVLALSESLFERNNGVLWFSLLTAFSAGLVQSRRRTELADPPKRQHKLSVIVICKNEEARIGNCLASVAGWADEIIVLDSGSTDATVEICHRFTDRVETTDWPGFGAQKQRALDRARYEWVLSLDADEVLSEELQREIDFVLAEQQPWRDGYFLPWSTRVLGKTLHHGRWTRSPLRLLRRDRGQFTQVLVHEKVVLDKGCQIGHLEAPLYHYAFLDLDHFRRKLARYAELQARQYQQSSRRIVLGISPVLRASWRLIDNVVLRAAFLDGWLGLRLAWLEAVYVHDKYRRLLELSRDARRRRGTTQE